ncbi:hypothetical protein CNMCM5623_009017 [Aspergillus felis]|uniref:DUF2278 family protein n=1 Tax=Aspergillus felis TaxID=1287682 RepID=A0A8H6Q080_9EURO|nr:hypothetical protein CNMCM5623_009017 [Aspergillus felis]
MPIENYGVWKANPVTYRVEHRWEDPKSPHLSLYYDDSGQHPDERSKRHDEERSRRQHHDQHHGQHQGQHQGQHHGGAKEIPGLFGAAINIKSGDPKDSKLAYWVDHDFGGHPIIDRLSDLEPGFHLLEDTKIPNDLRIDYIRSNLFNVNLGRILPHDIEGPNNDMIDMLEPEIRQAIDQDSEVYLFGSRFSSGDGIHDVHMNQGNNKHFRKDDGIFQDGALLIHFKDSSRWVGVFLGFASQSAHTDENGHTIGSETWSDYLTGQERNMGLIENSVAIKGPT